ncbi:MAG: SRPBCC family protein [Chloroflexota bacterium]
MITYRFQETIDRSADDIWMLAADINRHPQWMGVTSSKILSGDSTSVGSRGLEVVAMGPFRWAMEFVVTEALPGRRIAWRTAGGGPFTGDITLDLEPSDGDSTRATYHGEIKLKGLWRLLSPIMAMEVREGEARELRRLKSLLEGSAADAA